MSPEIIAQQDAMRDSAAAAMRRINRAWREGRVDDLALLVHPGIVMALPGFGGGRIQGREPFLAGFREFLDSAEIHEFDEQDLEVDAVGDTAVVTFRYEMLYERAGERFRATGRDLWVLQRRGPDWLAVWRTMLDMVESGS